MPPRLRRRAQVASNDDEPGVAEDEDLSPPPDGQAQLRQRRLQEFIRLAKTGSDDILQHYKSLIDDFDSVDAAIPAYIKAIVKTLQRTAEPQPVPRDKRRGLDYRLGVITATWGITKDELVEFFSSETYLSRNIIDRLYTLASRVDFEHSSRLLLDAQRARRNRNPDDDDLVQWKGISRSIPWMPRDIDQATEASGSFRNDGQATQGHEEEIRPPSIEVKQATAKIDGDSKAEGAISTGSVKAMQSRATRCAAECGNSTTLWQESKTSSPRTRAVKVRL
ncbi:hypothetical protein QQX98_000427 [Neonectria punicea]|uniref:Uncharacterized protein n=1 Tax=Neonectria punicea TaxID=979145 RepID=A0ABR1HU19_9HYPO